MPEIVDVPVADLLLDPRNARLKDEQASQQATILALAKQQGPQILELAADIVEKGMMDPTTLPAVVSTGDQRRRYLVLEGNRRILALKALETPSLVSAAYSPKDQKRLNALAMRFARQPIHTVACVLFEQPEETYHWINLRHTGQNQGVGLVEWGSDEKDRWNNRHGHRSTERQILEFVDLHGSLSEEAKASDKGIITSLRRLINTPEVRERLGIDLSNGDVISYFPVEEIAKSLTRIVDDLKTEKIRVADIYHVDQRRAYAKGLNKAHLPDPSSRLSAPVLLDGITKGKAPTPPRPRGGRRGKKPKIRDRTAVIPKDCFLEIDPPRINTIYNELATLSVDQFPNACSVLLRVFLELSVDHYVEQHGALSAQDRRIQPLAKRMKVVAEHLYKAGKINDDLHDAASRIADSQFVTAASTVTFNQFVHNQYVFPKATEIRVAWDELQPLLEKIWA